MNLSHFTADGARAALGAALDPYDPDAWAEVGARAVWSCLTEPGDGVAGALIAAHGGAGALRVATDEAAVCDVAVPPDALASARARWRIRVGSIGAALESARRARVHLIAPGHPAWSSRLDDLRVHAPVSLWAIGDATLLPAPVSVALVGSRAASAYGEHVTAELASDCALSGITVVSGAAYGIDGVAHRAALGASGPTIAVLAGGVDRPYPAGHRDLIERIGQRGLVVAETPCGSAPTKWRFLSRNRIIAALSDATVVVEAGWRSGTLNTAHHTADLGRPLGAVPGPVTSASSAGCHRLLREMDAVCVTGPADLHELVGLDAGAPPDAGQYTGERTRILDALTTARARDSLDVARRAGFAPDEAAALLGLLELEGAVQRLPDGWRRTAGP